LLRVAPADVLSSFFSDVLLEHPVVAPFFTPIYSNVAFQILAYALKDTASTHYPLSSQAD
jgi:hypothetical protein